jgi:hypothetical protein
MSLETAAGACQGSLRDTCATPLTGGAGRPESLTAPPPAVRMNVCQEAVVDLEPHGAITGRR